jgi:hypothetical protein
MIRIALAAGLAALATSACGESGTPEHVALVRFCQSDSGGTRQACICAADKLEQLHKDNAISPEMFRALVLEAQGKPDQSDAILEAMTIDEKFAQVTAVGEARASCDENAAG